MVGLKVSHLDWKEAGCNRRFLEDWWETFTMTVNEVTVKELLILILLGTMSSCRQDVYFPVVQHHVIRDLR